jgi:RNA polymerase sigma-70 factor, ECF subfamily
MDVKLLFEQHYEPLFRYLVRLTGDADKAADATQEAFVRLVERPPQDHQVRAWLFRVATNFVKDESRVHRRRLEILRESPDRSPFGDQPMAPDDAMEVEETRNMVRSALDGLSLKERTVLLMR